MGKIQVVGQCSKPLFCLNQYCQFVVLEFQSQKLRKGFFSKKGLATLWLAENLQFRVCNSFSNKVYVIFKDGRTSITSNEPETFPFSSDSSSSIWHFQEAYLLPRP